MKDIDNKIYYILVNFDFTKVHDAMTALKWKWHDGKGPHGVPTITQCKKLAKTLLKKLSVSSKDTTFIGTGGFEATRDGEHLSLRFVVSDWDSQCYKDE